jgi:DNA mismatch endonuclease (patch repair protein)
MPSTNVEYWTSKIERTLKRDQTNFRKAEELGWECFVVWECEVRTGIDALVDRLAELKDRSTHMT